MVDWPAIVERHGPCVWRTAFRLLSDYEEANECYQETFLAALEFSRKSEVTSWPGLLRRIATSRALDRLRRRYRSQVRLMGIDEQVIGHEPAPEESLQQREWMDQLRSAIAELPTRQADVFWLSEVEKMSHAEIAVQLDANAKQVANWLHRAKQKLRQLLVVRGITNEVKQ